MVNDRNPIKKTKKNKFRSPENSYWLYGSHVVATALKNPLRRLERLLATPSALATLGTLPEPCPKPELVEARALSSILPPGAVHQGIVVKTFPLSPVSLDQVLSARETELSSPILILDQVTAPRNVGAILRLAAAFKATAIIMQERHAPEESGAMAKAASGALDLVPLVRVTNLSRTINKLSSRGYWIVGLDHNGPTSLNAAPINKPVALVLGGEGQGLRRLTRENCDVLAKIDIETNIGSLNVSTAASIALYELSRRR